MSSIGPISPTISIRTPSILIKAMQTLKIREGDMVVLECPEPLSAAEYNNLGDTMRRLIENLGLENISVAILDGGIKAKIIRPVEGRLPRRMDK